MRSRTLYSLVALALISACSSDIPTPTSPASLARVNGATRSHVSGGNHGTSNKVKYSNTGVHPATGRSGSATLEVRALLGMDGSTVVEATTGRLEDGTSAGTIAKVQLKSPGTQNFNNLNNNGYWSTTVAGLSRGQGIQVQANVRGIDPKRTDVVTVTALAAKRPDIAVSSLNAGATAPPNVPVMISATVSELNGDVGARADCVLSINGVEADRADGIWVDALGTVSCLFSHTFSAAGSYDLSITAANVAPGDWDVSNNSASASLTVADPGGITHGSLSVAELHYSWDYLGNSTQPEVTWERVLHYGYDMTSIYLSANQNNYAAQPIQRLDVTLTMDGGNVLTQSLTPNSYDSYDDGYSYRQECTNLYSMGRWFDACSSDYYGTYPASTHYSAQIVQGSVTYLGHDKYCYSWGCNTFVYNYADVYGGTTSGLGLAQGSVIRFQANFVGPNNEDNKIDQSTQPLVRYNYSLANDYTYCYSSPTYSSCTSQLNYVGYRHYGSVYW